MLPYIDLPKLHLGPIPIQWFGLLVATAVIIGTTLARWRAGKLGIDRDKLDSFISWMLVGGFVGAHVLDSLFYHPDEVLRRPWSLLFLWEGLSSFGGFAGAVLGIFAWKKWRGKGQPVLQLIDLIASVFPIAWIFGRAGCAVVHDHPGKLASAGNWLAVAFPEGPRYDLGLLEMFFAVFLSIVVALTWRRRWKTGFYITLVSLFYAPVRFALDFLRIHEGSGSDPRYFGLTPAQYACIALFGFGLVMAVRTVGSPAPPIEPPAPAAAEDEDEDDEPVQPKSKKARAGRKGKR